MPLLAPARDVRGRWILCLFALPILLAMTVRAQDVPEGNDFRVNTYPGATQQRAVVAGDREGNFVVVWSSSLQDGSDSGIFGRRFDASGAGLGDEFAVNTYTTSSQNLSSVAMSDSGEFVVVWRNFVPGQLHDWILGQRYDATGMAVGAEFSAHGNPTFPRAFPDVAITENGRFVVVWHDDGGDGSQNSVKLRRFDTSGATIGGEILVNSYTTFDQNFPAIAMAPSGDFVVVWQSDYQDGSDTGIFGQRFDATGMAVGGELQINTVTTGSQFRPDVAMDAAGGFVVVWSTYGSAVDEFGGIVGQRFDVAGLPIGGEFQINSYTTDNQRDPRVAADDSGNFVVVWRSDGQDGDGEGVFAQRFDAAGVARGAEIAVNTGTAGEQRNPSVASIPYGDFVVSWSGPWAYNPSRPIARRFRTNKIGDLVFRDSNGDGIQSPGEQGVANVTVRLFDDQSTLLRTTETRSDGSFRFSVIPPGQNVFLRFEPSTDWDLTLADQGGDDTLDSDPDPLTGDTIQLSVAAGELQLQWDAGVVPLNTMFFDGFESGDVTAWSSAVGVP